VREKTAWAPRIAIAAALSTAVLTEGCMTPNHPECGFYFRGQTAQACDGVRCKLTDARKELHALGEKEKVAARTLRAKLEAGQECREELDAFNSIHAEMQRISKKLDGYMSLETKIRDGNAEEGEIQDAFEEVVGIMGKIVQFEQALAEISRNI
jgi:hypothetical protein